MLFQNPTVKNNNHDNPEDFRCGFETLVQKQSDVEKDMLCWTIILTFALTNTISWYDMNSIHWILGDERGDINTFLTLLSHCYLNQRKNIIIRITHVYSIVDSKSEPIIL